MNQSDIVASPALLRDKLSLIDCTKIPQHIAIIMDGNRRWAKKHKVPQVRGHYEGAEALMRLVQSASHLGVKILTVFAFSTENWSRTSYEVRTLMALFKCYLLSKKEMMLREGVRLDAIGDLAGLPKSLKKLLCTTSDATKDCDKIRLTLALNYGGRDEIVRTVARMLKDYENKKFGIEAVSEELIASYLDTSGNRDPDLLIRTSGELRVSNFLLWQISYTEIYVTDVLWPDFTEEDLIDAVLEYQNRERRLGGS